MMTDIATDAPVAASDHDRPATPGRWVPPDLRRWLQLVLAAVWLWDGVLQYQSYMFTKAFGSQILAPTAQGNPAWIADSITWAAGIVEHNPVSTNTAFATIQLLLGLGIAWRPTVKPALVASIVWALGVWWFGEGLGGVLAGGADPLSGAPGAVILYAVLAVLLWPTTPATGPSATGSASAWFVAARPVGALAAKLVWLVLWVILAFFALVPAANRASQAVHDMIAQMASGQPQWLVAIDNAATSLSAGRGLVVSIVLAVVLAVIAVGVFLPAPVVRALLVLAVVVAAVIWVVGEAVGGVIGGQGTDPNTGPLLALLAAAYWPLRIRDTAVDTTSAAAAA